MRRTVTYAAPLLLLPVAVPILFLALIGGTASQLPQQNCATGPIGAIPVASDEELDAEQMQVATQIVAAVRAFPATADKPLAAIIALATARQESGIRNLDYGDRDSLGAFQQRPSQGWGTPDQVRDVAHATTTFLQHLVDVPGWQTRRVTDVAADVQRPAEEYRGLYQQWVPLATRLIEKLWPLTISLTEASSVRREGCDEIRLAAAGDVVYPVPPNYVGTDNRNWGASGSHWSSWHTGTDFSIPCGTHVLAAHTGRIEIDRNQPWAGPWLVKIVTGPDSLATWYAHMQSIRLASGLTVNAGEPIGEAGALGDATGCHLHFEVHLHNGTIYGPDNVNPSSWLAARTTDPDGGGIE